ncbi:MAG: hypothetical protein JXC32_20625 [Anaerolineae bacterium]|nr:hypothetical protein [Anaerolineae bacterium]
MPDWARLVGLLYEKLGTWQAVADECANGHAYAPSYYWRIAHGEIERPGRQARLGIIAAVKSLLEGDVTELNAPTERAARYGFSVNRLLGQRITGWRNRHQLTVNQWAEHAQDLMEKHYGN